MITRRQSLAMTLGAVTTAMVARAGSSLAPGSLHELAKLKGMRFGSTVSDGPRGSFIIVSELTMANLLSWGAWLHFSQGVQHLLSWPYVQSAALLSQPS